MNTMGLDSRHTMCSRSHSLLTSSELAALQLEGTACTLACKLALHGRSCMTHADDLCEAVTAMHCNVCKHACTQYM